MTEENPQQMNTKNNTMSATIVYTNPDNGLNILYYKCKCCGENNKWGNGTILRQMEMGLNRKMFNTILLIDEDLFEISPFQPRYNCRREHEINLENGYELVKDVGGWLNPDLAPPPQPFICK